MKKAWFFISFLLLTTVSYSQDMSNRSIFIGGTAGEPGHHSFFMQNFRMEGVALGYTIVDSIMEAGYTFRYDVRPNMIVYDDGYTEQASREEGLFVIMITLTRNFDDFELVSFGFTFSDLNEMLNYNQYLFFRAIINIPPAEGTPTYVYQDGEIREVVYRTEPGDVDDSWRNRMFFLRASVDFPINMFLLVRSDELYANAAVYIGEKDGLAPPLWFAPLDNRFTMVPGFTLGLDVQVFEWLSFEPVAQVVIGNPIDNSSVTFSAGALLKYQFRFLRDSIIAPYGAFMYALTVPSVFEDFPRMSAGLGFQTSFRFLRTQVLFLDIGYHINLGEARLKNWFQEYFTTAEVKPATVPFRPHSIRIGIGYKFGFMDGPIINR